MSLVVVVFFGGMLIIFKISTRWMEARMSQLREHKGKGRESGKMNYAPARTIKLSWVLRAPHYSFINFVDIVEGGNGE